jgi:hypothetical protein
MAARTASKGEFCPVKGCVVDFSETKVAAKEGESRRDPKAHLRVARAYHKLHRRKNCQIVAQLGLGLDPSNADKKIIKRFLADAEKVLSVGFNKCFTR